MSGKISLDDYWAEQAKLGIPRPTDTGTQHVPTAGVQEFVRKEAIRKTRAAGNKYKDKFLNGLRQAGIPDPAKEYFFARPDREWRWDFAWPDVRLAVEYQGGIFRRKDQGEKTGHNSTTGMLQDHEKYNNGAVLEWYIILIQPANIEDGTAVQLVQRFIERRQGITTPIRRAELMTLRDIEMCRLGYDVATTIEAVAAVDEMMDNPDKNALWPNYSKPTIIGFQGKPSLAALHEFGDDDLWVCVIDEETRKWKLARRATEQDLRWIHPLTELDKRLKVR